MYINTENEEYRRLERAMKEPWNVIANTSFERAKKSYEASSPAAFYAAAAECWSRINVARILQKMQENPEGFIQEEKKRISEIMKEFESRAPFDDGGHHASNADDGPNTLRASYQEVMDATSLTNFFALACGFWACLNSLRQTEGLPPL